MKVRFSGSRYLGAALALVAAADAGAHESGVDKIEEVIVYGRSLEQIGSARSASEGIVGYDDYAQPPLLRVGELLEAVPGMIATQHSGTGKANQYFLRGFNLDHGTDFAAFAEGVPLNLRTHGHGQGYLDLNFLIPELVETTTFRKGPYRAEVGDFGSAGSADFAYYDRIAQPFVAVSAGFDDYYRGLVAGSVDVGAGVVTAAADATGYSGPWDLDEDLRQYKGYMSYAQDVGDARFELTAQAYTGQWNATDQIPLRAEESGEIDRLGFVDPDLGGDTSRYALTASVALPSWSATVYAIRYDLSLFSNFTYFLEDPLDGDEFEQRDDRHIVGGVVRGAVARELAGRPLTLSWGTEARRDDIDEVGLFHTVAQQRIGTVRDDDVVETSLAAYGDAELAVTDRWRVSLGVRGDYFDYDVSSALEVNGGDGDDSLMQPKLSTAYRLRDDLEVYASFGRGFHSNDVRGATIRMDPVTGDPADQVDVIVESDGGEIGLRYELGQRLNTTLTGFWLDLDSELVFVGDAGTTEPNDATKRRGVEATVFWQALDWLALNAAYTYTDAHFDGVPSDVDHIPGSVESVFAAGLNARWANGVAASVRVRYLGEAPMIEDDSVRAPDSVLVNAGVAYQRGALEVRVDAFNIFDTNDYDISYFYESRLANEADAVEDIHFHPLEPFTLRAGVTWHL